MSVENNNCIIIISAAFAFVKQSRVILLLIRTRKNTLGRALSISRALQCLRIERTTKTFRTSLRLAHRRKLSKLPSVA